MRIPVVPGLLSPYAEGVSAHSLGSPRSGAPQEMPCSNIVPRRGSSHVNPLCFRAETPERAREPQWLGTESTLEQTVRCGKEDNTTRQSLPVRVRARAELFARTSPDCGGGTQPGRVHRDGRRRIRVVGARQGDFGSRHFGRKVRQPPPLGEALGRDLILLPSSVIRLPAADVTVLHVDA